ncbi:hypothetical protein DL765_000426 [Monosporascus sp. GIB2]|nr:hypothetical protein DL765_000426 [Monosporascus sp. GIB2]
MAPVYTSAGGTAVVGDNVTYSQVGATVGSPGANKSTRVYIPITNPQNTTDALNNVFVECKGNSADAKEIYVYFGNTPILDANVTNGSTNFEIDTTSSSRVPDSNPYGIDVSIDINFTSDTGTFEIYSVTLQFGS